MKVIYIAGPYTGDAWAMHANVQAARDRGREVAELGAMPLIPHSNTPPMFVDLQTPEFWYEGTIELLTRCDALITVAGYVPGSSRGTEGEIQFCIENGVPFFTDLQALSDWLKK